MPIDDNCLLVCCMCPTIKRHNNEYILDKDFFERLCSYVELEGYIISHGYCHTCKEQEMAKIKEFYARGR